MKMAKVKALTEEELRIKADELLLPGNKIGKIGSRLARVYPGDEEEYDWVPDYPNDIAAAWPLLASTYGHRGISRIEIIMTDGECEVVFWTALRNTVVLRQWKEGDSPERAITRAFILAMDTQHNDGFHT